LVVGRRLTRRGAAPRAPRRAPRCTALDVATIFFSAALYWNLDWISGIWTGFLLAFSALHWNFQRTGLDFWLLRNDFFQRCTGIWTAFLEFFSALHWNFQRTGLDFWLLRNDFFSAVLEFLVRCTGILLALHWKTAALEHIRHFFSRHFLKPPSLYCAAVNIGVARCARRLNTVFTESRGRL